MTKKVTHSSEIKLPYGERIKECRKSAGYTQEQLIQKIEGLPENKCKIRSEKHLSALERGKRELSLEYAYLLSKVLSVRKEYLLCEDDFKIKEDKETHDILSEYAREWLPFSSCVDYLEKIGYDLEVTSWLICPSTHYESIRVNISSFIYRDNNGNSFCQSLEKETSILLEIFSPSELVALNEQNYMSIHLKDFNNKSLLENSNECSLFPCFAVKYHGKFCGFVIEEQLRRVCEIIHNHTQTTMALFFNGTIK